jgi:hypothetical protein
VCIGHALQKAAADDKAGLWEERDLDAAVMGDQSVWEGATDSRPPVQD